MVDTRLTACRKGRWPVRIRDGVVTLLLLSLSPLTISAQGPTSLQAADQAFADALTHHDRAAFKALLSPDATSSLPVAKHGPDAIEASWLPFLIDPGTTMVLTCVDVRPAVSGNSGKTTGNLAVTGRTNQGVQTVPLGTYVIEWTMVDGQWKIGTLGGILGRKPAG
jgi:ketosteroid isomerase-like protein